MRLPSSHRLINSIVDMLKIKTNDFLIDTRFYHFQGKKLNSSLDGNKSFEDLNALLGECQDHFNATPSDVLIKSLGGAWNPEEASAIPR